MTTEEKIVELKWVREKGFVADKKIIGTDRIIESIDSAIEALKKQIPLRANNIFCPRCGSPSIIDGEYGDRFNYCYECGQEIDWSEEE